MLDIVVCSNSRIMMEQSINVINMTLIDYDIDYHIHKFTNYSEELNGIINSGSIKIYILDVTMGKQVASLIRKNDFDSIIILVCPNYKIEDKFWGNGYMPLDYLSLDDKYFSNLRSDLVLCIKIIYRGSVFTFKYNHVIYRIPYMDITYIEKESRIKRCIIHTCNNTYYVVNSIENLSKLLGISFVKIHQSCIINLLNVNSVDLINNTIIFNNGDKTSLLSDKSKKMIKNLI